LFILFSFFFLFLKQGRLHVQTGQFALRPKINRYLSCLAEIDRAGTFQIFVSVLLYYFVFIVIISMCSFRSWLKADSPPSASPAKLRRFCATAKFICRI